MEGWIKIHRSILKWEWYDDINTFRVFIHLLLTANHESKKWRGIRIRRGQMVTSVANLGKSTGLSAQSVRTSLTKLKSTNELTIKSTNIYTIITICKYEYYQDIKKDINKQDIKLTNKRPTNEQQTSNKRATTTKEGKKERTKEGKEEEIYMPVAVGADVDDPNQMLVKKWHEWCQYRKHIRKPYKTTTGAAAAYNKLLKLAGYYSAPAIEIIQQSIENEWVGFFPLKSQPAATVPGEDPVAKGVREMQEARRILNETTKMT